MATIISQSSRNNLLKYLNRTVNRAENRMTVVEMRAISPAKKPSSFSGGQTTMVVLLLAELKILLLGE